MCTLRFDRKHYADESHTFNKGVDRVFHGQVMDVILYLEHE